MQPSTSGDAHQEIHLPTEQPENCLNCGTPRSGSFCSHCGQKKRDGRLTVRRILGAFFQSITNLERGFWFTFRMLFTQPGKVAKDYIEGRTVSYMNPVRYVLIMATASTLLAVTTGVYDIQQENIQTFQESAMGLETSDDARQLQQQVREELKNYLNLFVLGALPFIGLVSFWLYRRQGYNYAEHLAATAFWMGHLSFFSIPLAIIYLLAPQSISFSFPVSILIGSVYYGLAYRQLFGTGTGRALLKGTAANIGGFLFLFIAVALLGLGFSFLYVLLLK